MPLDDLVCADVARESADGADHQTEEDDTTDLKHKEEPSALISRRKYIAKPDGEDGLCAE